MNINLKDTHYLASWEVKDLELINKLQTKIRNGERNAELGELFFKLLDSKYNDHHPTPEPTKVCIDDKYLMTWKGVSKFCRLITKQDTDTFTTVAVGTGSTIPKPFDTNLVSEKAHVDFSTNGFFDGAGTTIRYAGTFPSTTPSGDFKESLVRNQAAASGSVVMCRNIFPVNFIDHNLNNAGFTAAGIIEFIPLV